VSVSLILLPLAISAVVAAHASRTAKDETGRLVCHVQTRMRNPGLLADALRDTGAEVTAQDDTLVANWEGVRATFQRNDDDVWTAHLEGSVDLVIALPDRGGAVDVDGRSFGLGDR